LGGAMISPQTARPRATVEAMTKSRSRASFALFVLFADQSAEFFRSPTCPVRLAEPIRKEFHLSDTALGLLGTVAL
jgi:hypothetical protein